MMDERIHEKRKASNTSHNLALNTKKDDFEINYYAKKLKLKKDKKNVKSLYNDGLGEILEYFDEIENNIDFEKKLNNENPMEISHDHFKNENNKWVSKRVEENKKKFHSKKKHSNFRDESILEKFEENNLNNEYLDDSDFEGLQDDDDFEDSENEEYNNGYKNENDNRKFSNINTKIAINDTGENIQNYKNDIYGRLVDEKGNIVKEKIKIVKFEENDLNSDLKKKIKGLFNRVSLKTMPLIIEEMENIFQNYSNNSICMCIFVCINELVIQNKIMSLQKLCTEIVMMIAILHSRIGEEVSANILNKLVKRLDEDLNLLKKDVFKDKELENLLLIICIFYGINIVSEDLIYDILNKLIDIFNYKSIELILFCLKLVGLILRKDNSNLMKELIINVKKKASSYDKEKISEKKIIFILDELTSIKNNLSLKKDLSDIQGIVSIDRQSLRKDLINSFKNINFNCLKGTYNEILKSNRWFMQSSELLEISIKKNSEKQCEDIKSDINKKLIQKLKLTTPFRQIIFKIIATCEDYVDCCQNIIKITKKQHFEVINVCIYVSLKEKEFNPFYSQVLRYLCHVDRNFKRGVLFDIKKRIQNLNSFNSMEQNILKKLIVELIKLDSLSLSVLNTINFKDMTDLYKNFVYDILVELFKLDLKKLDEIFKKLPRKDLSTTAIKMFINLFLPEDCKVKLKKLKNKLVENIF